MRASACSLIMFALSACCTSTDKVLSDTCSKGGTCPSSFLQFDGTGKLERGQESDEVQKEVAVKEWDCGETPKAYQSTTADGNQWTKFAELDLSTGMYIDYFKVNLDAIAPDKIRSMNSCAINPKDKILYCSMEVYNKGSFLVRIDQENTIGYVTKLLGWRYAATFDHDDNYYVSGQNGLTVLKNVSTMAALPSYDGLNNIGETPVKLEIHGLSRTNYELGADFEIFYADWEGTGKNKYLVSLKDTQLLIVRVSPGPYQLWTLETNLPDGAPHNPRVWGAAWKWGREGSLFFAADDGLGMWKLLGNTVDLKLGSAKLKKISKANPTSWNDGFTCGEFCPPKVICPPPLFNCTHELYQSSTKGKVSSLSSKSYIQHMTRTNMAETVVDFEITTPELLNINACAVNPVDKILYCCAQMSNGERIARVGNGTLSFVQHAPAAYAFAGYFDSKGNYWIYAQKGLFSVSGLNEKESWSDYKLPAVALDKEWTSYSWAGTHQFRQIYPDYKNGAVGADFIIVEKNGKDYLVSIVESKENSVSVIDLTGVNVMLVEGKERGAPFFKSEGLPAPLPGNETNTWGSAWQTRDGKLLFARDYGGHLYELTDVDLNTKTVFFELYGEVEEAAWHDGISCVSHIAHPS